MKMINRISKFLISSTIFMSLILFATAWKWSSEEKTVYGTWDSSSLTYTISKSSEGPIVTIKPRGSGWRTSSRTGSNGGTYTKWLEPSGKAVHTWSGEVSVGVDSIIMNITRTHSPYTDDPSFDFKMMSTVVEKIEASLKGKDTLEGTIKKIIEFGPNANSNYNPEKFLAGRREQ